jgi:hypothetical protein
MPASKLEVVPNEVWTRILEFRKESASPAAMCALTLVCQSWKARTPVMLPVKPCILPVLQTLVEPILFRAVQITDDLRLLSLLASRMWADPAFGGCIRKLDVQISDKTRLRDSTWSALVFFLLRTPQVRMFDMTTRPIRLAHLECLRTSATHLTSLSIAIFKDHLAIVSVLNGFTTLQELKLCCTRVDEWSWKTAKLPVLKLPHVVRFYWLAPGFCAGETQPRLLSGFTFARGGFIVLQMPNQVAGASLMSDWLCTHAPKTLVLDMPPDTMVALSQPISRIADVRFVTVPPLHAFRDHHWPCSITLLPRPSQANTISAFLTELVALLADEATRHHVVPQLVKVKVTGNAVGLHPFHWYTAFTRFAISLNKHNIQLVDSEDRDLKSHFG